MIVCLDLETTWLDKNTDKIIEIALLTFCEQTWEIKDTYSTLINPQINIPELISNITNIFDQDVKNAPILDDKIKKDIKDFIWDNPILWHNIYFDIGFLEQAWIDFGQHIILDTFFLSNILMYNESSLNLWSLCDSIWFNFDWLHRAINDVKATIKLFIYLKEQINKLPKYKKELLSFIFSKSQDKSFEYFLSLCWIEIKILKDDFIKNLTKHIKKDNNSKKINQNKTNENKIKDINIEEIFNSLPVTEIRQNQLKMSKTVLDSLQNNKKYLIEAPTWVWKTFAYLIPSIFYALKNDEKIFISTNTKALQDQIYYKDLDFLEKNLWLDFSYTKLKWKRNYIWVLQLINNIIDLEGFNLDETSFFGKMILWIIETDFWELDELTYYPKEFILLKNLNADNFMIYSDDNPYKNIEFVNKSKQKANESDIIIINHNILAKELETKNSLLPKIDNLIIDEAHNLEDTLTSSLEKKFSYNDIWDIFNRIRKTLNTHWQKIDNIDNKIETIISNIEFIFDLIDDYKNQKNTYNNDYIQLLLEQDFYFNNTNIDTLISSLEIYFIEIFNELLVVPDKVYLNIKSDIKKLEEILEIIKITLTKDDKNEFIPMCGYNKFNWLTLSYTYLNIWKYLEKKLWDKISSVILTSATLDLEDNFWYFKNMYFLEDNFDFLKLESDFDYNKQWLIFVPNDLWSIKYQNSYINDFILKFLLTVWWNTLCLFTSFASIKENYLYSNQELKKNNINLLAQSIWWSKHKILNSYISKSDSSVIFWTDSFWEWIDISWDKLKYLLMHKFPFLVPTDPIFKARSKLFKDSFRDYSIPKAILKTKQWFWRLIRSKTDAWIFILLDDRFYNSKWWDDLKKAFPKNIKIKIWDSKQFLDLLKGKK